MKSKSLNYVYYSFIGIALAYVFLYYFASPFSIDDWDFSSVIKPDFIYSLNIGRHPGRNISEVIPIFIDQVFGVLIGSSINNMMLGMRISRGIFTALIAGTFWYLSSLYIEKNKKLASIFLILLSGSLPVFYFVFNYFTSVIGGYVFGLLAWFPFYHYLQHGKLPSWMYLKPNHTLGIYLLLFYCGTQVSDSINYTMLGLSLALLCYLLGQKLFPMFFEKNDQSIDQNKLLYQLLASHIVLGFFGMFRNIFRTTVGAQSWRYGNFHFELFEILKFIKQGGQFGYDNMFYQFSLFVAGLTLVFYLYKFIKNKKIERQDYFIFSVYVISLCVIFGLAILNTYFTAPLWMLWIVQLRLILDLWDKQNFVISLLLPTSALALAVAHILIFLGPAYQVGRNKFIPRGDEKILELLQEADKNGQTELKIPIEDYYKYHMDSIFLQRSADWAHTYHYTKNRITTTIEY